MRNNLPVWALFVFSILAGCFMVSCPEPPPAPPIGRSFWAINISTSVSYRVNAKLLFKGKKCEIWAENGSKVTKKDAQAIASMYDTKIQDLVLNNFGIGNFEFDGEEFENIMELASWITSATKSKHEKFIIFLLDIKDGYEKGVNDAYVAGYFTAVNYFNVPGSNLANMIYIDTDPGMKSLDNMYETFAHEFQHLVSFMSAIVNRSTLKDGQIQITSIKRLDTWIDEGMSTMAEYLYQDKIKTMRYIDFLLDLEGTIAKGNNFYVWDNHPEQLAILDEYATTYMFFQWLRLQSGNAPNLFNNINGSTYSDYRAVTAVAKEINPEWDDWEILLRDWLAANYINDSESKYGYKGQFEELTVRTPMHNGHAESTLNLYPGEGVYSKATGLPFDPKGSGEHIRYFDLEKNTGDALLSFNANSDGSGKAEKAYLTGIPFDSPSKQLAVSGSLQRAATSAHPRVIDARDIIGRQQTLPVEIKP